MEQYILTLDQGTTSSRAILFNKKGQIVSKKQIEFKQYYPNPGWVEHDPEEIWFSQKSALEQVINNIDAKQIVAIAITNQRETTFIWDRTTGEPIYPAIVWQCRRTAGYCEKLKARGLESYINSTTGLTIDAYFSATKIRWILDNVDGAREKARGGRLCFGTADSWLLWKLTGGKVHATDYSNASRTMIYDINKFCWDDRLLEEFDIPKSILPEVLDTSGLFGMAEIKGRQIPIMAMVGDQQAALFGQTCFEPGEIKNTYGTGCFLLCNTGKQKKTSRTGLLSTIAWRIKDEICYAMEGSVFNAGSAIQWLRDEMNLINKASDCDTEAGKVKDSGGVYFVPAFTGLGAPYWDMHTRGTMFGITRGTSKQHIVRAVLDSIAFQSKDIIEAMKSDLDLPLKSIYADGGACACNTIMQFQADILGIQVYRPKNIESTALGGAFMAGLASSFWVDKESLRDVRETDKIFYPEIEDDMRTKLYSKWQKSIECAMLWKD